jgi:hypothetical protein
MNSPRTVARHRRIRDNLDPLQVEQLKDWLIKECLTYEQAQARLLERFRLKVASGTLSKFWYDECQPAEETPKEKESSGILLDVIVQSKSPIRLTILKNGSRLALKVGRDWKSGAKNGKSIVIGPDPQA